MQFRPQMSGAVLNQEMCKLAILLLLKMFFNSLFHYSIPVSLSVQVEAKQFHVVDSRFLSVALGSSLIREGWKGFDFK